MLVPTINRDFSLGLSHFHLALQKSSVCCVPTTLLKNHNQRSVAGWTTTAWLAVIKERLPKDTHDVKINNNFTSLPTYDYSPLQAQPIMSLLINLRDGSVLVTKHPDLTIWTHFLSTTEPHTSHEQLQQQPELKALAHLPQPPLKHPSSAFRANCFSSCKTQLKGPLLQETNPFLHWAPMIITPDVYTSLSQVHHEPVRVQILMSPRTIQCYTSIHRRQRAHNKCLVNAWVHRWTK